MIAEDVLDADQAAIAVGDRVQYDHEQYGLLTMDVIAIDPYSYLFSRSSLPTTAVGIGLHGKIIYWVVPYKLRHCL